MATGRRPGRPRSNKNTGEEFENITAEALLDAPPAPASLNEDGQAMWAMVWAGAKDWATSADTPLIVEMCQVFQAKEKYRRALDLGEVPDVYRLSNKTQVPHPYVKMLAEARRDLNGYFASLGLSPDARTRLGAMESLTDGAIQDFLKAKQKNAEARAAAALGAQSDDEEEDDWDITAPDEEGEG